MYKDQIIKALERVTGLRDLELEVPVDESHGDYSSNVALKLFSSPDGSALSTASGRPALGGAITKDAPLVSSIKIGDPRDIAEEIVKKLSKDRDIYNIVSKIEVAGPGFINFWLSEKVLFDNLEEVLKEKNDYGRSKIGIGKTLVIDYSSPNIAKRFSIGHLRSTIIGQALYNIYSFLGWKTVGDNHLGDWGTQFGVLIYMVETQNLDPTKLSVDDWEKLYVSFHKKIEQNPDLKEEARKAFASLEKRDKKAREIWQAAYDTSMGEYDKIYKRLGVHIDYAFGESFYEDKMSEAIDLAIKKGVAKKSGKALAIEFDKKYNLPSNLLVKSNGTTTYLTRDLALMIFRKKKWNPDLQIFEVGADQKLYFQQVFALAEMLGLFNLDQLKHVAHGMFRFKEGKMSTRHGRTIKLEEVLDEAVERAKKLGSKDEKLAEEVGIGAIKWNDLKRDPTGDIVFDWDEVLNMEGNSGPYLQYTYARTQSVLRKSKKTASNLKFINNQLSAISHNLNAKEALILRSFAQFQGVVVNVSKIYSPNLLCNYLYDLAQKYNAFYNAERIIGSENEKFLLALTFATGQILKNGLNLLGIKTPSKM
jgi:arginyl-tRNA synthetase